MKRYLDQELTGLAGKLGGVFASQACHHVDLLRICGGKVKSVYAKTKTSLLDIEAEDIGAAIVEFENGIIGTIEVSNVVRPENIEASITVMGENGTVEVGGMCANKMKYWSLKNKARPNNFDENPPNIFGS